MPPLIITATEYLVISGVPSATPAWRHRSLRPLKQAGDQRGADRVIPHTPGVETFPFEITVTRKVIPMVIVGDVTASGVPYADGEIGLQANIDQLNAAWVDPPGTSDGLRTAVWHLPSGATRSANVRVEGLDLADGLQGNGGPGWLYAALRLAIPAGRFT